MIVSLLTKISFLSNISNNFKTIDSTREKDKTNVYRLLFSYIRQNKKKTKLDKYLIFLFTHTYYSHYLMYF